MRGHAHFGALLFIATVVTSSIAEAQTLRTFTVGNWAGGAYARDGRFTHCASVSRYASGTIMMFSINRQYQWGVAFMNRDWRLRRDAEFNVALSVDGAPAISAPGHASHADQINVPLANSADLFERFRRGHALRVSVGDRVFSFNLEGTSAMLARLHDCVRRYTQPAGIASLSGGKARKGTTTADPIEDPALQAEAAVLLANVMAAANVRGYAMGAPEEAAQMGAHAYWKAPSILGSLLIIPTRRLDDPEIPGLVVGVNALRCNGAFMSGSLPSDGTRDVRVTTTCQRPGQPLATSYYFGIPRPRGGLYLFSTRTSGDGGREDAERTDEMIRKASYQMVN